MKKKLIISVVFIALFSIPLQVKSQDVLKFYDFENWADGVNPTGWSASFTINVQTGLFPIPIVMNFGSKNSSEPYEGNYALQISPYHFEGLSLMDVPAFTIPGVVQLGKNKDVTVPLSSITDLLGGNIDMSDPETLLKLSEIFAGLMSPGIPVPGNVSELKASFRFLPAQGDEASIIVMTSRWNSELKEKTMVAMGTYTIDYEIPTYTEISIPLNVLEDGMIADSISLVITVGGENVSANTKLFVDNLSLLGTPVHVADYESIQYSVYPNPVSETLHIIPVNPQLPYTAKLFDISGKLVLENSALINHTAFDVKNTAKGAYLLELTQGNEKYTQKIVIQ